MQSRKSWLDALRVASTVAVVIIHVAAKNWGVYSTDAWRWTVFNFWDSIARWAVPVFVMMSGLLFLGTDKSFMTIVRSNLLRLVTAFFFWSVVYAIPSLRSDGVMGFLYCVLVGHYHMWFVPMMAGLYLVIPILRPIARDDRLCDYFLLLAVAFAFVLPFLSGVATLAKVSYGDFLTARVDSLYLNLVTGYTSYFLLGFRLGNSKLFTPNWVLILGFVVATLLTFFGTQMFSIWKGEPVMLLYGNFSPTVLVAAVLVFKLFKNHAAPCLNHVFKGSLLQSAAKLSFGVYLAHPLVMNVMRVFGVHTMTLPPIVDVPFLAMLTVVVSYMLSYALSKVPILGRWVV